MKKRFNRKSVQKKITSLNRERTKHISSLVHGKPMVHGLLHEVYRKCGKPSCKCAHGEEHGPYPALSVNREGKQKIVMVKKNVARIVITKSRRYRKFQETLVKIRKINKEIDRLLEEIKSATVESYP